MMKKVLYIVEDEESAQFRYRVKNVAEATLDSKKWQVEWMQRSELELAMVRLNDIDMVVILRQTDKNGEIGKFIKQAQLAGKKVLFDLDDLIFDYLDMPLLMKSTNSKNVVYWAGYFWGIRQVAKKVDGFLCTNDFLASKLERSFNKPVGVIPNSLNHKQIEVSEKWVEKLKKIKQVNNSEEKPRFSIGYFSGSPTHANDFKMIEKEITEFMRAYDNVVLKIVGDIKLSREMKEWTKKGRLEMSSKVDYLRLQGRIAKVDVNIAPLLINDFTNCKSELKFFEAAVVETTTIASPTFAFKKAIIDGKNGLLAQLGEWYDKLEYVYLHPDKNQKMAQIAKKDAMAEYYGKSFLKKVEDTYGSFV